MMEGVLNDWFDSLHVQPFMYSSSLEDMMFSYYRIMLARSNRRCL